MVLHFIYSYQFSIDPIGNQYTIFFSLYTYLLNVYCIALIRRCYLKLNAINHAITTYGTSVFALGSGCGCEIFNELWHDKVHWNCKHHHQKFHRWFIHQNYWFRNLLKPKQLARCLTFFRLDFVHRSRMAEPSYIYMSTVQTTDTNRKIPIGMKVFCYFNPIVHFEYHEIDEIEWFNST